MSAVDAKRTSSSRVALAIVAATGAAGVDPSALLDRVGLHPDVLSEVDGRLPHDRMVALFDAAAALSGDDDFGLHAAERIPPTAYGVLGYAAKTAPNLAERLAGAVPSIDEIAVALASSRRTLQRRLSAEGTSFRQIVDEVRQDLALRRLRDPTASISEVAFLLGFSELSTFYRAFDRWMGQTPAVYRQQSHASR